MGKKLYCGIMTILLAFAIMAGGTAAGFNNKAEAATVSTYKYTMYIGFNDKKTNKQMVTSYDGMKTIEDTCLKYLDGVTIIPATGMCMNADGNRVHENTIVCYFYDTDDATIHKIADELIKKLNQSNILIEKSAIFREYYNGSK